MNLWIKENEPEDYSWSSELEVEPLNFVLGTVKRMISNIVDGCNADEYKIYLSAKSNFRHKRATLLKYKGNRDKRRAPLHIKDIRDYLTNVHDAETWDGYEADDVLAMGQTDDTVIASIDKDLLQIPGKHYNFVTGDRLLVCEDTAKRNRLRQILTGDGTDNIPGIYRVGAVTADKILDACSSIDEMNQAIIDRWEAYLQGDKNLPEWFIEWDGLGTYVCKTWDDTEVNYSIEDIIAEVSTLITVGEMPDGTETQGA